MSKYRSSSLVKVKERNKQPHYLWRGIGCVMMLIIPAMSYAAASITVSTLLNTGYPIPYQLLGRPVFPSLFYKSQGLMVILAPITKISNLYANLVVAFIYMLVLGGMISLIYALVFRFFGPSRYSPLDEPPPKYKAKAYKR